MRMLLILLLLLPFPLLQPTPPSASQPQQQQLLPSAQKAAAPPPPPPASTLIDARNPPPLTPPLASKPGTAKAMMNMKSTTASASGPSFLRNRRSERKGSAAANPPPSSQAAPNAFAWEIAQPSQRTKAPGRPQTERLAAGTSTIPTSKRNSTTGQTRAISHRTSTDSPDGGGRIGGRPAGVPADRPDRKDEEVLIVKAVERAFAASNVKAETEAAAQVRLRRLTLEREFEKQFARGAVGGTAKTLPLPPPASRRSSVQTAGKSTSLPRPSTSSSASLSALASPPPTIPEEKPLDTPTASAAAAAGVRSRRQSTLASNSAMSPSPSPEALKKKRPSSTLSVASGGSVRAAASPVGRKSILKESSSQLPSPAPLSPDGAGAVEVVVPRTTPVASKQAPHIPARTSSVVGQSRMPNGTLRSRLRSGIGGAMMPTAASASRQVHLTERPASVRSTTGSSVLSRASGSAEPPRRRVSTTRSLESAGSRSVVTTIAEQTRMQRVASSVALRAVTMLGALFPGQTSRRSVLTPRGPSARPPMAPSPTPNDRAVVTANHDTRRRSSAKPKGPEASVGRTGNKAAAASAVPAATADNSEKKSHVRSRSASAQMPSGTPKPSLVPSPRSKSITAKPSAEEAKPRARRLFGSLQHEAQPQPAKPPPPPPPQSTKPGWLQSKATKPPQPSPIIPAKLPPPPPPPKSTKPSSDSLKGKMPAMSIVSEASSTTPPPTDVVDPSFTDGSVVSVEKILSAEGPSSVRPPPIDFVPMNPPTKQPVERTVAPESSALRTDLASQGIPSPAVSTSEVVPSQISQIPKPSNHVSTMFTPNTPESMPAEPAIQTPRSHFLQNHPIATSVSMQQNQTIAERPSTDLLPAARTASSLPPRSSGDTATSFAGSLHAKSDALGTISPTSGLAAFRAADAEREALDAKRDGKWRAMIADQRGLPTEIGAGGDGGAPLSSSSRALPPRVAVDLVLRFVKSEKFNQRVCKGPPRVWRGYAWYHLFTSSAKAESADAMNAADAALVDEFHAMQAVKCIYDEEIELDAQNALANHEQFLTKDSRGQRGIFRVLNAFTQRDVEFGYNSAMVKIAAMLLLNMEEERAYIALIHLYHPTESVSGRFGLRSLHASGLPGLPELLFLHDELIKVYAPRLRAKFASIRLKTIQYATHWYVALFCNCTPCPSGQEVDQMLSELERLLAPGNDLGVSTRGLTPSLVMATFDALLPFRVLVRMWDLFALYGYNILAVIGVALLRKHEAFLMTLDRDDIISFFLPSSTPFVLRRLRRAARSAASTSSSASSTHSSLPRVPMPLHFSARSPSPALSLASPIPPSPIPYESGDTVDLPRTAPSSSRAAVAVAAAAAAAALAAAASNLPPAAAADDPALRPLAPLLPSTPPPSLPASPAAAAAPPPAQFIPVPPVWTPDADDSFVHLVLAIWNGAAAALQAPPPPQAPSLSAANAAAAAGTSPDAAADAAPTTAAAAAAAAAPTALPSSGAGSAKAFWSRLAAGGSTSAANAAAAAAAREAAGAGHGWDAKAGGKALVNLMRDAYGSSGIKLGMLVGGAEEMRKNVR
ncbi:rab-GTPase-TBC domain-containing protein [Zopfochytrium polystomum]|nr:rab-GTPase-TBC domain-containing protein [Zopfochytrium polystomum]